MLDSLIVCVFQETSSSLKTLEITSPLKSGAQPLIFNNSGSAPACLPSAQVKAAVAHVRRLRARPANHHIPFRCFYQDLWGTRPYYFTTYSLYELVQFPYIQGLRALKNILGFKVLRIY